MPGLLDYIRGVKWDPSPVTMGMLMAGANMLTNSGPSRTPIGLPQILGHGLQGYMVGANSIRDYQLEQQDRDLQRKKWQQDMENDALESQYRKAQIDKLNNPGKFADPYYSPVQSSQGFYNYDHRTGQVMPVLDEKGLPLKPAQYDPSLQGMITRSKEDQKILKGQGPGGEEFYDRGKNWVGDGMPPADLSQLPVKDVLGAIKGVESNGNYAAKNPKSSAYGAYQVTEGTANTPWFQGMPPMTDKSPAGQDAWAEMAFKRLLQHNGGDVRQAISDWHTGPFAQNTDYGYVNKVVDRLFNQNWLGSPRKGPSIAQKKAMEKQGEAMGDAQAALPGAIDQANYAAGLLNDLKQHPGLNDAVGLPDNPFALRGRVPGTKAADFNARLNQIKGGQFMEAIQKLRGTGQITEIEGKKATDAIARLDPNMSEAEFKQAIDEAISRLQQGMKVSQEKAGYASQTGSKPSTSTPSGGIKFLGFE